MVIVIFLALVNLLLILVGIELTIRSPLTYKHKWSYRIAFVVLGLLLIALTIIQHSSDDKEKAALAIKLDQQHTDFIKSEAEYKKIIVAMSNSPQSIQAALSVIANTPAPETPSDEFNPANLQEILVKAQAKQSQRLNATIARISPIADHVLKILNTQLINLAKTNGDSVVTPYSGLATTITSSKPQIWDLQMKSNLKWHFQISVFYADDGRITITRPDRDHGMLQIMLFFHADNSIFMIQMVNGSQMNSPLFNLQNYQSVLDPALALMLATQAEDYPLPK